MQINPTPLNAAGTGSGAIQAQSQPEQNTATGGDDFKPGSSRPPGTLPFAEVPTPTGADAQGAITEASRDDDDRISQELENYVKTILNDPAAEGAMISTLQMLNDSGRLRRVLHRTAAIAAATGNLSPMSKQQRKEMVDQIVDMIDAEFRSHGMTTETHGKAYKNWETMGMEHLALVRNSCIPPRGPGELSAFTEPAFVAELETLQGATFRPGNRVTPLIDGPASFAERNRLIDTATRSIHMMTWAFYDDETGWETARKLAARHREGLDVQVVVDGQVSERLTHPETMKYLEDQGVPVIRWRDPKQPYLGQHRKVMIVDGAVAIAGGLNPGNFYSHMGPANGPKWRDTDVMLQGPAVADCERLFASVCGRDESPAVPSPAGDARTAIVNHVPGSQGDAHIMLANMKAIQGASETIDIENAYYIRTPGLRQVIMDALARGVRVRIMTNSAESVDEQIVSAPILRSLPELVEAGAEVYIKKGDTLHSKFLIVDGLYSSVGSYNLHPRSERYEGEMTVNTLDTQTAGSLTGTFEKDIALATRVSSPDQIVVPENLFTILPSRYFFDQL